MEGQIKPLERTSGHAREKVSYHTILVDPPWTYRDSPPKARVPYETLSVAQITSLSAQIRAVADDDSHLYLWATKDFVEAGHRVMRAWGFAYKNIITWDKVRMGLGYYQRNQTEFMLFGVRGTLPLLSRAIRNIIRELSAAHSRKPEAAYRLIEAASPGPYLELFARRRRSGWSVWGTEVDSDVCFDVPSPKDVTNA